MPRKPQDAVEPRPNGRWAVQTDATMRADSHTELVVTGGNGRIVGKDSHGNDRQTPG